LINGARTGAGAERQASEDLEDLLLLRAERDGRDVGLPGGVGVLGEFATSRGVPGRHGDRLELRFADAVGACLQSRGRPCRPSRRFGVLDRCVVRVLPFAQRRDLLD
jgi:hypothetical protein